VCTAAEHFMALYVFVIYLEETDFLFDRFLTTYELDFHGSFYIGIISFICSLVAALVVYADSSISRIAKPAVPPYAFENYCFNGDVYEFCNEQDYLMYQYGNTDNWYLNENKDTFDESYEDIPYDDLSYNSLQVYPNAV
jgi:hypothetical protein